MELVLSSHLCGAREQTQVVRFVPWTLCPLSHLAGPVYKRLESSVLGKKKVHTVKASKQNPRKFGSEVFTSCLFCLHHNATVSEALRDY